MNEHVDALGSSHIQLSALCMLTTSYLSLYPQFSVRSEDEDPAKYIINMRANASKGKQSKQARVSKEVGGREREAP